MLPRPRAATLIVVLLAIELASAPVLAQAPPGRSQPPWEVGAARVHLAIDAASVKADRSARAQRAEQQAAEEFPPSPAERLARAEQAFRDAEYPLLRTLLEPTLLPTSQFSRPELELKARALLAVGLYFEAQQVIHSAQRDALLDAASLQFLELLRKDPFFTLNPLIYPASVVELFARVNADNATELEALRAAQSGEAEHTDHGLQTVYIAREVDRLNFAANFLPFGFGQFQNDETIKGVVFASTQAIALGLNMGGYWMVESLRSPIDGKYEGGAGNSAEAARTWQTLQYVGLGAFAALYVWSVLDGLLNYQPFSVRIRTLDEPPPELSAPQSPTGSVRLQMGWNGVGLAW